MRWGPCTPAALAALGLSLLLGAAPAGANPIPVDGKDPKDGTTLTGFRLQSEDGGAFLYFMCDEGEQNPRLWISHGHEIGGSTKPFRIAYSIDGGPMQKHWFFVLPNRKSGAFFPRYNQMYEERFGATPEMFDKQAGAVSPAYVDWYDNIYNSVVADFGFGGDVAVFKLWEATDGATDGGTDGASYSYLFNLIPLRDFMPRLTSCYEPPRNYTPVAPSG